MTEFKFPPIKVRRADPKGHACESCSSGGHSGRNCSSESEKDRPWQDDDQPEIASGLSSKSRSEPLCETGEGMSSFLHQQARVDWSISNKLPNPLSPFKRRFRPSGIVHGLHSMNLATPLRPSRSCDDGGGEWGCDPDDDPDPSPPTNPSPPWNPYHEIPDCTVPGSARPADVLWCSSDLQPVLRFFHDQCWLIAKTAARSLDWMAKISPKSRSFYWNWGLVSGYSGWWHNSPVSKYASLAWWFGDYSDFKFEFIWDVFLRLVNRYQTVSVQYKCDSYCIGNVAARNWGSHIQVCPGFWNGPSDFNQWRNSRIWMLFHENVHGISYTNVPRDVCSSACYGGWRCAYRQCYGATAANFSWNFEDAVDAPFHLNNPRNLIVLGDPEKARKNVDNYVSWAIARFADANWGLCNSPNLNVVAT